MTTNVRINLKRKIDDSYNIEIGTTLSEAAKSISGSFPHAAIFVITDTIVGQLYGKSFLRAVNQPPRHLLIVPSGEKSKNRNAKEKLEDKLLALHANRISVIVALGGGVIGDLAGFVAATLLRGVSYIQIPTTLLAQVDSSIGGKVAVDHPLGKNLIGAFHQPKKVYIDPATLRTLPDEEFTSGMAEVIKYAAIMDKTLFGYLEGNNNKIRARNIDALHYIIGRCCKLKKSIVEKDEKEAGLRRILNFGHTIGHAIESLSNYHIPHGQAVAIGMSCEAKASVRFGLLTEHAFQRLERLIAAYHLPTSIPSKMNLATILELTARDKKARDGAVHYALLERIGKARVGVPLSIAQTRQLLSP